MRRLEEYSKAYRNLAMERHDGILLVRLHSAEGELVWEESAHRELPFAFRDIAADPDNLVVILTGTGENFLAGVDHLSWGEDRATWQVRDRIHHETHLLLHSVLDLPVPVIAAVNGPARVHAELPLLGDVVLAADTALFQDSLHFQTGGVPGDGVHALWPLWLGVNRARYFLLTGQEIGAQEALGLGMVGEVLPQDALLDRAWAVARRFIERPPLTLRYTRQALNIAIKRAVNADLAEGVALEFLARAYPTDRTFPFIKSGD